MKFRNCLTSTDVDDRCKGSRLLADIEHGLSKDFMSEKELEFVTAFFCDRLKDHHSVIPHVLYGLLAVCKCDNVGDSQVIKIIQAIFQEVHTQTHVHSDRRMVFTIFATLLQKKLSCLVYILGINFVYGYIQAVDGEKDPRNLVMVFNTLPIIVDNFPLGELAEEIFEIVSCYFPVDFEPPPNNPFGVTRNGLEIGLRKCLTASPKFAEFCIPLLQEKLESDILTAKLDSLTCLKQTTVVSQIGQMVHNNKKAWLRGYTHLSISLQHLTDRFLADTMLVSYLMVFEAIVLESNDTMQEACSKYGIEAMKTFIPPLWTIIRREYFSAKNLDVQSAILLSITSLTKCASLDKDPDTLGTFLATVLKECKHHILDKDNILREGGAEILCAVASGSFNACGKVLNVILPLLIKQYDLIPPSVKKDCLVHMAMLIDVASKHNQLADNADINSLREEMAHLMLSEITSPSENLSLASLNGLIAVVAFPKLLNEKLLDSIVENTVTLSFKEQPEILRPKILELLSTIAKFYVDKTKSVIVPLICSAIENVEDAKADLSYDCIHNSAIAVSSKEEIVHSVIKSLVSVIKKKTCSPDNKDVEILRSSLNCMQTITKNCSSLSSDCIETIYSQATLIFIEILVNCTLENSSSIVLSNIELVSLFAANIRAVTQHLNEKLASDIMDIIMKLFFKLAMKSSKKYMLLKCGVGYVKRPVMASHPSMIQLTDKLIQLLGDPELGEFASEGFSIIVKDSDKVLNSSSQGVIMFMFKQRFFIETSQLLLDGFNSSPEYLKTNFLMALSHQLEFLPNQVLLSETNKLVPVLVQSLSIHNTSVINSSLQTIVLFMDRNPEAFSSHLQSLTCQLLKLSEYKENLTIRKSALACLKSIAKQPDYLLLPLKSNVISSLTKRLDDHKRLVRQAAADARCEWFLVGAPGN
ncbi:MMS19 nucleotide excision repair [Nymphon striatum]|nr:MMS19 nucleotide excision repair [Nymphon striatum]